MDVNPCSHPTDRQVSKIIFNPEPMMREEQINTCTSSGALHTVLYLPDDQLFQMTQSSVFMFRRRIQGMWRSSIYKTTSLHMCTVSLLYQHSSIIVYILDIYHRINQFILASHSYFTGWSGTFLSVVRCPVSQEEDELGPLLLPGWQAGDSRCTENQLFQKFSDNVQQIILYQKFKLGDVHSEDKHCPTLHWF